MAIRRSSAKKSGRIGGGVRTNGPRQLSRAELEQLQEEFAALSGEDREAADDWIKKLRPKLAQAILG
jgi:hypothetical protein